jgi:hypothetical protein
VAVTLKTSLTEVLVSNPGRDTDYPGLLQSLQPRAGIVPPLSHYRFFPSPLQFIIQESYHSTLQMESHYYVPHFTEWLLSVRISQKLLWICNLRPFFKKLQLLECQLPWSYLKHFLSLTGCVWASNKLFVSTSLQEVLEMAMLSDTQRSCGWKRNSQAFEVFGHILHFIYQIVEFDLTVPL